MVPVLSDAAARSQLAHVFSSSIVRRAEVASLKGLSIWLSNPRVTIRDAEGERGESGVAYEMHSI